MDHLLVSQAPTAAIAAAQGPTAAEVCVLNNALSCKGAEEK